MKMLKNNKGLEGDNEIISIFGDGWMWRNNESFTNGLSREVGKFDFWEDN